LASIGLSKFVDIETQQFDYEKLYKIVKVITKNLNKIIDINYYPLPETELSNKRHRPIGIGVQGLADVFAMLKMPFDSPEARIVNEKIFEMIYYSSMETSMEMSKKRDVGLNELKTLQSKLLEHKLTEEETKRLEELKTKFRYTEEEINRTIYIG
jgi:ribonucleotide reductase alpha subunit